jgi:hypothetical protein
MPDFKRDRDYGKGKRGLRLGIADLELSRMPASLQQKLLKAEQADNPTMLLYAWAALYDPALGALQLSLDSERDPEDEHQPLLEDGPPTQEMLHDEEEDR